MIQNSEKLNRNRKKSLLHTPNSKIKSKTPTKHTKTTKQQKTRLLATISRNLRLFALLNHTK
jgi:hypothetical protein